MWITKWFATIGTLDRIKATRDTENLIKKLTLCAQTGEGNLLKLPLLKLLETELL
jgi:hypothetical protein